MSKAKYTQGMWSVADYGHCIAVEVELDNGQEHTIMTDQFCHAAKFNGDAMANARLIAASPEMYEMLRFIYSSVDWSSEAWNNERRTIAHRTDSTERPPVRLLQRNHPGRNQIQP